jgi:MarR family transcriptional regulator, negative regulator of the multidrug operon emrRAB
MGESRDEARLVNLLGAVAIGLNDAAVGDVATDAALDGTAAAALVALLDLAQSGSVRRLSQLLGLTHSGTVRLVNRLADAGHVRRAPGPDMRTVSVRLTRPGRVVARRIRAGRHAAIATALTGLTAQQRDQLSAACEVLIANMTTARLARRGTGAHPSGGALCRVCDPAACGRLAGSCPAAEAVAGIDISTR